MKLGPNGISAALGALVLCLLPAALAQQSAPEQKPLMSEDAFKNVQVLKGIPVSQFMTSMGFFSASLGQSCEYCHVSESSGSWEKYADDNDHKQTARKMVLMMAGINRAYFGGRRVVTCYSCHRGGQLPKVIPSLAEQYGVPPASEPDEILAQAPNAPPAEQILDKYIEAAGGSQRLTGLNSVVASGTYQGYDTEGEKRPFDVFAKASGQRTTIIHMREGDSITTFDGRNAWIAAPQASRPIPLLALTGRDLDGAAFDANLTFPARIRQVLTQWRVGFPFTIDDRDVQVVQATTPGKYPVKLYFDPASNLLVRVVRYTDTPVGLAPTQIDYSDYRDVSGIKIPFHWVLTWVDGRSTIDLTQVRTNVAIDAGKFAQPTPPARR